MALELKVVTVNLKSLDQDIEDPVIAGAGDANGRTLRFLFTQEAAAQFSPNTKVYLSWHHKEQDVYGLNVFTKVCDEPLVWEIKYPRNMLFEGNVLCCVKLIDEISIVQSTNFTVHVLSDPDDGLAYIDSDDYSVFQEAVLNLNNKTEEVDKQLEDYNISLEENQSKFDKIFGSYGEITSNLDILKDELDVALDQIQQNTITIKEWTGEGVASSG